jgi:glycosyltransferase involved in cell wall biosynthesis
MSSPFLSVVVPVYNEEENIVPFYTELLLHVPDDFELIWIDDGSTDNTWKKIDELANKDGRIRAISLSRNFGHQPALLAGIQLAKGELTLIMDGDLQHPPLLIPLLINEYRKGFDMVSARRANDKGYSFKSITSPLYYRILNFLSDTEIEPNVADFRIFSRKVKEAILSFPEREIFLRGMFGWIGFRKSTVDFTAPERQAGRSKYSSSRMFSLGLRGVIGFSFKPLRISLYTGLVISLLAFGFAVYALAMYLQNNTVPGWTSLIIAVMFLGGIQLIMIGLIGEYIASLFSESKKRPVFIIDRKINC